MNTITLTGDREEQRQADPTGQAAAAAEGERAPRAHLFADGAHARHPRGVPQAAPLRLSGQRQLLEKILNL